MKTKLFLAAILFIAISFAAEAQPAPGQFNRHRHHGIQNGSITPGEAYKLHRQKKHIRRDIAAAKLNDGRIGPLERRHIKKEQHQFRRQHFIARHNRH